MLRWIVAVCRSFGPAFAGLWHALKTQRNLQVHAAATVVVVMLGLTLKIAAWEWCVVTLAVGSVWTAELLNSAVEALADRVSMQREEAIDAMEDGERLVFLRVRKERQGVHEVLGEAQVDRCDCTDAARVDDPLQSTLGHAALSPLLDRQLST